MENYEEKKESSEDLEEYAKKLTKGAALDKHNLIWMCKKGAEWQKQQYEKLFSKDSWTYIEENYPDISQEEKLKLYDISIKSRLAGAECQKQKDFEELLKSDMSKFKECYEKGKADAMKEIMKDAVEGTVVGRDRSTMPPFQTKCKIVVDRVSIDAKEDDKVKVIIANPKFGRR